MSILGSAKVQKEIVPGRFIVISHNQHVNKLALVLQVAMKRNSIEYKLVEFDFLHVNVVSSRGNHPSSYEFVYAFLQSIILKRQ